LEGRGQVAVFWVTKKRERVSYIHNKRLKNKLFTLECVLPSALSLEGVGVEENKRVGHG
jgi:hypothetical protein